MELTTIDNGYTLKMFADATNKRHDNVKRDFNKMLDSLSETEVLLLTYEELQIETKRGDNGAIQKYETYSMDKRTALLFASKFNDSLRLKLIMTIEAQTEKLIAYQQALIEDQQKHNLVTYADGTKSLRKIIRQYYPDVLKERETWRYLVKKGLVKYEPRTTYIKVLQDNDYGEQVQDSIKWDEDKLCEILDELAEQKEMR